MKAAMEERRHWLDGAIHSFQVITDHNNLEYVKSTKGLNPRQARWSLFFSRFQFTVIYRPGIKNSKADALSRCHDPPLQDPASGLILPLSVIITPVNWDIMEEIQRASQQDPPPGMCPTNKQYVPQELGQWVMQWVHTSITSVHLGISHTTKVIRNAFWWPAMNRDVTDYVKLAKFAFSLRPPKNCHPVFCNRY